MRRISIVPVAVFVAVIPILCGLGRGIDYQIAHYAWAIEFIREFLSGEYYPRWLPALNNGLGSPVFFFYPPLAYSVLGLLAVVFRFSAAHALDFCIAGAFLLSYPLAFVWLKSCGVGRRSATLGALVYALFPYHLYLELYHAYAFAELWAVALAPITLIGWQRIKNRASAGPLVLAIGICLLLFAHPLTAPAVFLVLFIDFLFSRELWRWKIVLFEITVPVIFGILCSCCYLWPAWRLGDLTATRAFIEGQYGHQQRMPFSFGPRTFYCRAIEEIVLLSLVIAGCALKIEGRSRSIRSAVLTIVTTFFLMTPLSLFLWDNLAVLQYLQSPWRFATCLTIAISFLTAKVLPSEISITGDRVAGISALGTFLLATGAMLTLPLLPKFVAYSWPASVFMVLCCAGLVYFLISRKRFFQFRGDRSVLIFSGVLLCLLFFQVFPIINELTTAPRRLNEEEALAQVGRPEYRPKFVPIEAYSQSVLDNFSHLPKPYLSTFDGITIKEWRAREIKLQVSLAEPVTLEVGQFYLKGWVATQSEGEHLATLPARANSKSGLLELDLPSGSYEVLIALPKYPEEMFGYKLSAIGLLGLAFIMAASFRNGGRRGG